MVYILSVFSSSKCSLFHNSNIFGSCIINILFTGVLKLKKKNNSGTKRLSEFPVRTNSCDVESILYVLLCRIFIYTDSFMNIPLIGFYIAEF